MSGLIIVLIVVSGLLLTALITDLCLTVRDLRVRLRESQDKCKYELRQRLVYERALGLPLFNLEQRDNALWVRAMNGDDLAQAILEEKLYDDVSGASIPALSSSGDSKTQGTSLH